MEKITNWGKYNQLQILNEDLSNVVNKYNNRETLVVSSKGSLERFVLSDKLQKRDLKFSIFDEFTPEPDINYLTNILNKKDFSSFTNILSIGGGSTIDVAKFIIMNSFEHYIDRENNRFVLKKLKSAKKTLPISHITVPTTCGTGSEATPFATLWDKNLKEKYSFQTNYSTPKLIIHCPSCILKCPKKILIQSSLDTLSHTLECMWNKKFSNSFLIPIVDSLKSTFKFLNAIAVGTDLKPHINSMQQASTLAGCLINQTKTASAHSISYPFTTYFGIPHGIACSFTLPEILRLNMSHSNSVFYNKIAKEVGFLDALNMADHIEKLLINLNVGYYFDDIFLTQDWTSLLKEMSNPSRMLNNIINFNEKDILKIVSKSLVKLSNK